MRHLTHRKTAWANKFRPDVIRGLPLSSNASVELRYKSKLDDLIEEMSEEVEKSLVRLFVGTTGREFFAEDASISAQARILLNALREKFDKLFATNAERIADSLAIQSDKTSSTSLYSSIQKLSGGLSLPTTILQGPMKEILKAGIAENVALIKSIPSQYFTGIEGAVYRSVTTGNGLQSLVPYLAHGKGVTLRRARFIAKDQTKKFFEDICSARMDKLGLGEFEWMHVASNHPRKTHLAFAGNIYKLSEGAYDSDVERNVLPGELPGCRCKKIPVIRFGEQIAA